MDTATECFNLKTLNGLSSRWPVKPETWNVAAQILVIELSVTFEGQQAPNIDEVPQEQLEELFNLGQLDDIARMAMRSLYETEQERDYRQEVIDILVKKQADYGPRNILRFGEPGLQVRTWDKIARLGNLKENNRDPENESVRDTKVDIVGYTVIALMLRLGWFELPLQYSMFNHDK